MAKKQVSIALAIDGMSCGSCVRQVSEALWGVPGVTQVVVDLEGGSAKVDYDGDSEGVGRMLGAVALAGYGARAFAAGDSGSPTA